jgi:hypothetical protein
MSIHPTNLETLFHYYYHLPPLYRWSLEEKNVQNLELELTTCLDFKEKSCRTSFYFGGFDSHKDFSSLMPIIQDLQDHMLSLEHRFSKQGHLEISLDPSYLRHDYDTFTTCVQEFVCEDDHDQIMMLNKQPIVHIPNTAILETNRQSQPQDHALHQVYHSCTYIREDDYAKKVDFDLFNPLYDIVLYDDVTNKWSNQLYEDPFNSIDTYDKFSFENPHEVNQYLELENVHSNTFFQLKEVKKFDFIMHTLLMSIASFDNDNEFKCIDMILNNLYYPLHYDDPIPGGEIATTCITMFDESIDPTFDIQTLNLKPEIFNLINAFKVRYNDHLVGWHVLHDDNHLFWVLIGLLPLLYASFGWHVGNFFVRKVFQVMIPACKVNNVFLYAKCYPT